MQSVGENNTDGLTDGTRPSVQQSSVNPISVAKSVANKKKPLTDGNTDGNTDGYARQKKIPRGNITDEFSVGNFKGNYRRHYRRIFRR